MEPLEKRLEIDDNLHEVTGAVGMRNDRFREFIAQEKEYFSERIEPMSFSKLFKDGFRPLDFNGKKYYFREFAGHDEAYHLDEFARPIEHWRNWDRPDKHLILTTYDSEGYIEYFEDLRGTQGGLIAKIHYQEAGEGREAVAIEMQDYLLDKAASWNPRTLIRLRPVDNPYVLILASKTIK